MSEIVIESVKKVCDKAFYGHNVKLLYLVSSLKIEHSSNRRLKGHATVPVNNVSWSNSEFTPGKYENLYRKENVFVMHHQAMEN